MSRKDEEETPEPSGSGENAGIDERIFRWLLVIGVPFVIGFTTWLVIVLAFAQWKIY